MSCCCRVRGKHRVIPFQTNPKQQMPTSHRETIWSISACMFTLCQAECPERQAWTGCDHHNPLVFKHAASFQVAASAKVMPTMAEKTDLVLVTLLITTIPTCFQCACPPAILPGTITRSPSYRAGSQCRQVLWPMGGNLAALPLEWTQALLQATR